MMGNYVASYPPPKKHNSQAFSSTDLNQLHVRNSYCLKILCPLLGTCGVLAIVAAARLGLFFYCASYTHWTVWLAINFHASGVRLQNFQFVTSWQSTVSNVLNICYSCVQPLLLSNQQKCRRRKSLASSQRVTFGREKFTTRQFLAKETKSRTEQEQLFRDRTWQFADKDLTWLCTEPKLRTLTWCIISVKIVQCKWKYKL